MTAKRYLTALCLALLIPLFATQTSLAGEVARAQFTTGVVDREPVDAVRGVSADTDRLFFFTELRDLQGQHVVHRWEYAGEPVAVVGFDVGGPRWRVWSSKQMEPEQTGTWRVYVVKEDGSVLASEELSFGDGRTPAAGDSESITVPETHFMRSGSGS
ncbi:DUF2914 domain-containing protein [Thioalkalivibrio sulfidiphilus]|uniref:DUF2914 domain-containing protein n=1 Tax=Thioalkalivibrio sulfidiphilus TaxID=1033854 RepID=UPI003B37C037